MARRLPRLSVPFKLVVDRMTVGALVAASLMLLVIGKADLKLIDALATGAGDLASPALRTEGEGSSRRAAEQVAAGAMLELLESC